MKTWILIADAAHARVLESWGAGKPLRPVTDMHFEQSLPRDRDLADERPTRTHESLGNRRHSVEPRMSPRRALKQSFAVLLARELAARTSAFDRLIVVAPPAMLGDLRQEWSQAVVTRITAEVAKDLVKIPDHDLSAHLAELPGL